MKVEIINIGTELLVGATLNTHQQYLAKQCSKLGLNLYRTTVVGDNPARLAQLLTEATFRSDILLLTGGLGPTDDDITVLSVAKTFGLETVCDQRTLKTVQKRLATRRIRLSREQKKQAMIPFGSKAIPNAHGTAPGIYLPIRSNSSQKHLFLLPGPPRELRPMFEKYIYAQIQKIAGAQKMHFITEDLLFPSAVEAEVAPKVKDLLNAKPPVTLGIYAKPGEVKLTIMSQATSKRIATMGIQKFRNTIQKRFPDTLVLSESETLSSKVGKALLKKRATVAFAESCTSGLLSSILSETPGASKYFKGSLIAYHNQIKQSILKVPKQTLKKYGAVSHQVAKHMARNTREYFDSDYGISITGIAGPTGGSKLKPLGLVYIGIAGRKKTTVWRCRFIGPRENVQRKASIQALSHFLNDLDVL